MLLKSSIFENPEDQELWFVCKYYEYDTHWNFSKYHDCFYEWKCHNEEQWPKKVHNANQQFIDDYVEMWPCLRKGNRQFMAFCIVCCSKFNVALLKSRFFYA